MLSYRVERLASVPIYDPGGHSRNQVCLLQEKHPLVRERYSQRPRALFDVFLFRLPSGKSLLNGKRIVKIWVLKHVFADASTDRSKPDDRSKRESIR